MSTTTTTASPPGAKDGAEEAPKKSKLKIIVAGVLVVLIAAAAAWFLLLKPKGGADTPPVVEKGIVLPVEAININLADGHYLKLGFALQLTKDVKESPDPSEALALAIDQFSGAKMPELAKAGHRRETLEKFNKAVVKAYPEEVLEVYPTTFVMQ